MMALLSVWDGNRKLVKPSGCCRLLRSPVLVVYCRPLASIDHHSPSSLTVANHLLNMIMLTRCKMVQTTMSMLTIVNRHFSSWILAHHAAHLPAHRPSYCALKIGSNQPRAAKVLEPQLATFVIQHVGKEWKETYHPTRRSY